MSVVAKGGGRSRRKDVGECNADNIYTLQNSFPAGIAVVCAVMRVDDPYAVTQKLRVHYLAMCNREG